MKLRRTFPVAIATSLLLVSSAQARSVANPFSGKWVTDLGGGTTGTVYFGVIDSTKGASQLQAAGGHPCNAPTTYYDGYYTDTGNGGESGTMAACTVSATELVGRYKNNNTSLTYPGGDLDLTLNSTQDAFSGHFTSDDPSYAGMTFPYSGTFQSDFQGDGCCPGTTTTTPTTTTSSNSKPPPPTKADISFKNGHFLPVKKTVASGTEIVLCNTGNTYTSLFSVASAAAKDSTLEEVNRSGHQEWRLRGKGHKLLTPGSCGTFTVNNPTSKPIELHIFSELQSSAKLTITIEPAPK